jgi:hypothetical protein
MMVSFDTRTVMFSNWIIGFLSARYLTMEASLPASPSQGPALGRPRGGGALRRA